MTIEEYLAELRRHVRVGPLAKRRILREVEAHLRDAAEREGEQRALASFGSPKDLAARFLPARTPRFVGAIVLAAACFAGASAALVVLIGGKGHAHPAMPAYRLVRTSFTAVGSTDGSGSTTVRLAVLDRQDKTVAQVRCSSDQRSGRLPGGAMPAGLDAKTILGVPSPNCARTS